MEANLAIHSHYLEFAGYTIILIIKRTLKEY